ncbi:hypothetical protein ANN_14348 [Periplaneta americana]|uniref:Uncharacterized protein n=1 Tax=Periplaneta americana TaxID=6978 RepID=A0ABQ8SW26_PERAM|nr:hypothetical protein ANN_14348 [Periplaneta americana]
MAGLCERGFLENRNTKEIRFSLPALRHASSLGDLLPGDNDADSDQDTDSLVPASAAHTQRSNSFNTSPRSDITRGKATMHEPWNDDGESLRRPSQSAERFCAISWMRPEIEVHLSDATFLLGIRTSKKLDTTD